MSIITCLFIYKEPNEFKEEPATCISFHSFHSLFFYEFIYQQGTYKNLRKNQRLVFLFIPFIPCSFLCCFVQVIILLLFHFPYLLFNETGPRRNVACADPPVERAIRQEVEEFAAGDIVLGVHEVEIALVGIDYQAIG